jgi:hypothetical protein
MMSWILVIALLIMEPGGRYHIEFRTAHETFATEAECQQRYAQTSVAEMRLRPDQRIVRASARCSPRYSI